MKDLKSNQMENYLYSSVVIPLKGLKVKKLYTSSPLVSPNGRTISFHINHDVGVFRRNYQRDRARHSGDKKIILFDQYEEYICGRYTKHNHKVEFYSDVFKQFKLNYTLSKLCSLINGTSPFGKVKIKPLAPVERVARVYEEEDFDDYDEEGYGDDV